MLSVSLHGIRIHAPHGLYPQEHILGNLFEIDVDIHIPTANDTPWPFVDYTIIHSTVTEVFQQPGHLLETFVQHIHASLKEKVPGSDKIKVVVRKMHPPMQGDVKYSQVSYED